MQNAEAKLWFAIGAMVVVAAAFQCAGCSDRSAPAAAGSNLPPVSGSVADPPHDAQPQAVRDITFDTVKFDIKKDQPFVRSMLTPAIEKLHDMPIRIRGYILPSFQQSGLTQFVLVRDNMECCFGPGAALYDCIVVEMAPGKSTDFTTHPVAVEGVFTIHELRSPEDRCMAVYHLEADKVRDARERLAVGRQLGTAIPGPALSSPSVPSNGGQVFLACPQRRPD